MSQAQFKTAAPELLSDLATTISAIVSEMLEGVSELSADLIGEECAMRMSEHWRGQNIYFPMARSYMANQIHEQIYARFNGHNHAQLAKEFGFSTVWIYKTIKRMRALDIAKRQKDLFALDQEKSG